MISNPEYKDYHLKYLLGGYIFEGDFGVLN